MNKYCIVFFVFKKPIHNGVNQVKLELSVKSQKEISHPILIIISLEIFRTGISSFMHILRSYTATV